MSKLDELESQAATRLNTVRAKRKAVKASLDREAIAWIEKNRNDFYVQVIGVVQQARKRRAELAVATRQANRSAEQPQSEPRASGNETDGAYFASNDGGGEIVAPYEQYHADNRW